MNESMYIHKHSVPLTTGRHALELPEEFEILDAQPQGDRFCVWGLDTDTPQQGTFTVHLYIYVTGMSIPAFVLGNGSYLGTYQHDGLAYHVWAEVP